MRQAKQIGAEGFNVWKVIRFLWEGTTKKATGQVIKIVREGKTKKSRGEDREGRDLMERERRDLLRKESR